jgi:hypothetical protein
MRAARAKGNLILPNTISTMISRQQATNAEYLCNNENQPVLQKVTLMHPSHLESIEGFDMNADKLSILLLHS